MSDDKTYNGWTNYETWNVYLWITGDTSFYSIAKTRKTYDDFVDTMDELRWHVTPDHVAWDLPCINRDELNAAFIETF